MPHRPLLRLALLLAAALGATCARAADPALDGALLEAIVYHEDAKVRDLLGRGASHLARNADGVPALELAVREAARTSPAAATRGIVEALLRAGASPNQGIDEAHPEPLIATAIQSEAVELLELLLDHGADPDVVDFYGAVPLHAAIDQDNVELVGTLLDHGADPSYRNAEGDVLAYATSRGADDAIVALLD